MRHSLAMSTQQFAQIAELTPPQAASALLVANGGEDNRTERVVWDTWSRIVGGEPGNRKGEGSSSAEASFLVGIVRAIADGTEDPPVAEQSARRRRMQDWNLSSGSATTHIVGRSAA